MDKPTIAAAIIEANRAKYPGIPTTDYDHRARCMDVLIDAAQYRIGKEPLIEENDYNELSTLCPNCNYELDMGFPFCPDCGQALDWT